MAVKASAPAVQLKGSLFTLTVLELLKADFAAIQIQLVDRVQQMPDLFRGMPIILDLHKIINSTRTLDFAALYQLIRQQGLVPVGVRGGDAEQQQAANAAGFALLNHPTRAEKVESATVTVNPTTAKIILQPVRSGQQIYAKGTDLIVVNSVSPGAEILADGHIHIYGALRGRALAGVNGNQNARIFCQKLEAELVSIAGHYWLNEASAPPPIGQMTQVYLEAERLRIEAF